MLMVFDLMVLASLHAGFLQFRISRETVPRTWFY
jgi:hypothetical protein